jgi:hypothetical protein
MADAVPVVMGKQRSTSNLILFAQALSNEINRVQMLHPEHPMAIKGNEKIVRRYSWPTP